MINTDLGGCMKAILIAIYAILFLVIGGAIEFTIGTSDWFVLLILTTIFFLLAIIPFSILISPLCAFFLLYTQDEM